MVKKIRLIEEEQNEEELDAKEFQAKALEYMQSMDWKLWEMFKIAQRWADENGYGEPTEPTEPKAASKKTKSDVKPIIVDEE